jgi:co-chaperonin GroES (HSP10)
MLKPLNDTVVIEPIRDEVTDAGIVLPANAHSSYRGLRGRVVAVGPGAWTIGGYRLAIGLEVGQVVLLCAPGMLIKVDEGTLCFVNERDVLAVIG